MRFRSGFRLVVLAASSMLIVGCHSTRPDSNSAAVRPQSPRAIARAVESELEENRRIEAHARYSQAVLHDLNDETELALAEYFQAALHDPENEALVLEVSRRLLQAKRFENAIELLTRATARSDAPGVLFARLGYTYAQLGKADLAVNANRIAMRKDPRSLVGYQNLYLIHMQNQRSDDALAVLDDAAKVSNTAPEFLVGLGELYANFAVQHPSRKDAATTRAVEVLKRAETNGLVETQLQLRLAEAFDMLGSSEDAARVYQDLLRSVSNVPLLRESVRAKLAEIYLRNPGDHSRAAEHLEGMLRDNPTNPQLYYFLGKLAFQGTNYVQAADHFSKVILLKPDFEPAYHELAHSQMQADQMDAALATLEKSRERFAPNFTVEYLSGLIYSHQRDYTNAMKHLAAAEMVAQISDPKRLADFYFQIGSVLERKRDFVEAEKYLEKALQLKPEFPEAQNYLGYMLADRGEKLEYARGLIEKAVKADPQNAAYLDSLGWVLYKLRQPKQALRYIQDAIKYSEEEDATVFDHLGDIYFALGDRERAREAWQKALEIDPTDDLRTKIDREWTGLKAAEPRDANAPK